MVQILHVVQVCLKTRKSLVIAGNSISVAGVLPLACYCPYCDNVRNSSEKRSKGQLVYLKQRDLVLRRPALKSGRNWFV